MESKKVVAALAALAQESRLQVLRLLAGAGPAGLAAGEISRATGIPPSSLSFHLKELTHAGLTDSRQDGRYVYYQACPEIVQAVAAYLLRQCCAKSPATHTLADLPAFPSSTLSPPMSHVTIYHNPRCGTSRNALGLLRHAGLEPQVVEYLKTPPDRATLAAMIQAAGLSVREAMREKESIYRERGLDDPALSDEQLLDAMLADPILINRPFVVTARGTRLCRPVEILLDILPAPLPSPYTKENGDPIPASGN